MVGIAGTGSIKTMGRIGGKAILYFEIVTTIALFLGLGAVNLVRPGDGRRVAGRRESGRRDQPARPCSTTVEHTFPTSIIDAMARGDVLQIVVFSFLFGAACAAMGPKREPVVEFCEALAEVMFRYTNYVMLFAPFGVFGAMAVTIGEQRPGRSAGSRQAGADAVRARRCSSWWWCWARSPRSRGFPCAASSAGCASRS